MQKNEDYDDKHPDNFSVLVKISKKESLVKRLIAWSEKHEDAIFMFVCGFIAASCLWLVVVLKVIRHYESKVQNLTELEASFVVEVDGEDN